MTIRHLKIFIAVAETGKMSAAAEKLYISQPTVSQTIRELEEHYQVLLFERLAKRLHITEAGRQLLIFARQTVEQFDYLEEKMMEANGKEHLKIGMTLTVGSSIMPQLLYEMEEKCPNTETYTYVGNTNTIEKKLLEAELNVGIVEGRIRSPELVSIPVVEDRLVLACGKHHPLAEKENITATDLQEQKFVMRHEGSGTRELLENYLREKHITICPTIEVDCIGMIKNAIYQSGCLAVVSGRLLETEIKSGEMCCFTMESGAWNRTFNLVYHKDRLVTESIEQMGEILKEFHFPVFEKKRKIYE